MTSSSNLPNGLASGLIALPNRGVIRLSGTDKAAFLQGLVTNNVDKIKDAAALYACLLTPQGKFLHDFFIVEHAGDWLIDCEYDRRANLLKRLSMYKLRSQVVLEDVSDQFQIFAAFEKPELANTIIYADPRHAQIGFRVMYSAANANESAEFDNAYEQKRIALCIPDGSRDIEINKDLIMEFGLDQLQAIDFNKGCYLGQEMTSRMFFRDLIKRRLVRVKTDGAAPAPNSPITQNGKEIGVMKSSIGNRGLALMRIDAIEKNTDAIIQYENFTLHLL